MTEENDLDTSPLDLDALADFSSDKRAERVRLMTDDELRTYHHKLAHPDVNDNVWTPLIEAELRRRSLLPLN